MRRPTTFPPTVAARRSALSLAAFAVATIALGGCASDSAEFDERPMTVELAPTTMTSSATRPTTMPALLTFQTFAVRGIPPAGWEQRTNSIDERSEHVTWLSPSGSTAYGVIFFRLPFPVGHEIAFERGFLAQMREREGEPEVLDKHWDDQIGGLRFTVRSPRYTVEAKFFVKNLHGYAVYAGTRTDLPVNEAELAEARIARESTRFAREIRNATTVPAGR